MSRGTDEKKKTIPTESGKPHGVPISTEDEKDVQGLYERIRSGKAQLVSPEGKVNHLPGSLYSFLIELLAILKDRQCVTIIEDHAKMTTVEAASLLGVSRQFLVNLLERHEIPHHMVGTHRRIYAKDVLEYKAHRDSARRTALRELAKAEMEDGLYDRPYDEPADAGS